MQLGDVVLYRILKGRSAGQERAAIVTRVCEGDRVDLHVFGDPMGWVGSELDRGPTWSGLVSDVARGAEPGRWRPKQQA